jgi:hypothetical protein
MKLLLEYRTIKDTDGMTALIFASIFGYAERAELLLTYWSMKPMSIPEITMAGLL